MRDRDPAPAKTLFEQWDELFTPDVMNAYVAYWGLPGPGACTDPETLRSAAEVQVAIERRIAAELEAAAGQR